jgi:hypothetical protein
MLTGQLSVIVIAEKGYNVFVLNLYLFFIVFLLLYFSSSLHIAIRFLIQGAQTNSFFLALIFHRSHVHKGATYEHPDRSALIYNSVTDDDLGKVMMLHWFGSYTLVKVMQYNIFISYICDRPRSV